MASKTFAKTVKEQTNEFLKKLRNEPRVKIRGDKNLKTHFGDVLTFTFNGLPVTVRFDGSYQEFPESIAREIEFKLEAFNDDTVAKEQIDEL